MVRLVGPPWDRGMMWCGWHAEAGWVQPGNRQCRSRTVTARRRCTGMVSVAPPMSSGRLTDATRSSGSRVRRYPASPPGPDSRPTARVMMSCRAARSARSHRPLPASGPPWPEPPYRPGPNRAAGLAAEQLGGELAEELVVEVAGDDRDDRRVTVRAGPGRRRRRRPPRLRAGPVGRPRS